MPTTNYLANKLLEGSVKGTTYTAPANVYMALFSTINSVSTPGTEISGNNYSRQEVTFSAAANGTISSNAVVSFSATGNAWPTVVSAAIMDASTSGNMLYFYNLPPRKINAGDTFEFASGKITLTLS